MTARALFKAAPLLAALALVPARAVAFDPFVSENDEVAEGNELLKQGKPAEALEMYDEAARALPKKAGVHLDRGLALSRMGDEQLDQAMQAFKLATQTEGDDEVIARAHANLGNAFFQKEDYETAIEHYKKSLMLEPGDRDVAWNLELASLRKKQKQEQQKQNQDQQDQDQQDQDQQQDQKDQSDQKDKQDQEQKEDKPGEQDEQKDEEQPEPQGDQDQQDEKDEQAQEEPKGSEQQPRPQPRSQQEIEQLLQSLEDEPADLRKNMARQKGAVIPRGPVKDW